MSNITPQVRAAYRNKVLLEVEPKRVENVSFNKKEYPVFIVPLGQLKGIMPVYESGSGIFDGTKRHFDSIKNEEEKTQIFRRMYKALSSSQPFKVKVTKIDGDTVYLSRREALKIRADKTLQELNIQDIKETEGKILQATVIAAEAEQAVCDLGGFTGILPRREIDYTNPLAFRVLKAGDSFDVKVLEVKEDKILIISRKALLPDPWENLDLKKGSVVRAMVINCLDDGAGLLVAYEPGVVGVVRNFSPQNIPDKFENVAVRIDSIDKNKKQIIGHLVS